jgi:hypothetical protein
MASATSFQPSLDGYVRITFESFSHLAFTHRLTWQDNDLQKDLAAEDIPAAHAGYCEWATDKQACCVSLGWAWFGAADGRILLAPGGVNSNVMFITKKGYDLGSRQTAELLQCWLSATAWQAG